MAVITATTRIESFERHYIVPPHRPHAGIRGDISSPYAYAHPQKHNVENMEYRHPAKQAPSSRHPAERSDATSNSREVARTSGENRQDTRHLQRQPPTPPWLQSQSHAPMPSASAPSLSGSMRFNNPTAASGLNGAFSGTWTSARPSPAHGLTQMSGTRTRGSDSSDSGMDEDESATEELRAIYRLPAPSYGGSSADVPLRSESDRFLGTPPSRSARQPTRTPEEQRELDASVQLPPIRGYAPQRMSEEHSPYDRRLSPAQNVRLPGFQTILMNTKLALPPPASGSSVVRGNSSSASPSPCPSVASVSTNGRSWSQADTEPTEDEDVPMGEVKRYGSFPLQALAPPAEIVRPTITPWQRLPSSSPEDDESPLPELLPVAPSTHAARAPSTPKARYPSKGKGKEAPAKASKPRRRAAEPKVPPQKKYRFVASHLSGDVLPPPEAMEDVERSRSASVQSGSKRKHTMSPSPAPSSSPDLSLASMVPRSSSRHPSIPATPIAGPSSRRQAQAQARAHTDPPKRRGRPPRPAYDIESVAPIDPDSPEGQGQFPVYSYHDEERPTPCQFPECETLLTGKKAETTSHLKDHFQKAGGRDLICPWTKTSDSGECTPCDKKFKDSANMGRHVATKHLQSEKYKCGKCHREFARRDAALRHMKTMCSPEKEQRRAAKRKAESDEESEDAANDADNSGSSRED